MAKPMGALDKSKGNKVGVKPRARKLATTSKGKLTGNQWQNTPQQNKFMKLWLDPESSSFGNAYESAITAGYSEHYANVITTPAVANKWIDEYKRRVFYSDEHIRQGIQKIAKVANNSKSPDDTRLKAYEILAKIAGMVDGKNNTTINIVQPILGGLSAVVGDETHGETNTIPTNDTHVDNPRKNTNHDDAVEGEVV